MRRAWAAPLLLAAVLSAGCGSKSVQPATTDTSVSTRVRTALLNDPQVSAVDIAVTSDRGVVTLTGRVRSEAERERAIAIARQTTGVSEVRSELAVTQP